MNLSSAISSLVVASGGEANLKLPDLASVELPRRRHQRLGPARHRPRRLRGRPGLRPARLGAPEGAAGAQVDARDLRADLRDLQDLPDDAGQVHRGPLGLHRRHHRRSTSACSPRASAPARWPSSWASRWSASSARSGVAWFGIRINTFANCRTAFASAARQALPHLRHPAPGRHVDRHAAHLRRAAHHALHPALRPRRPTPAPASSASPSASRWAPRRCASPAASSPRSPTSAPT